MLVILLMIQFLGVVSEYTLCPDRWLAFHGSCYLFGHDAMHFVEAENFCRLHNGNLVKIESSQENQFLKDVISDMASSHFWLGMTDEVVEGSWEWFSDKTPIEYTDWAPTEPQNAGGGEDCALIGANVGWADVSCTRPSKPICESNAHRPEVIG